jgi:hypothetical protein
MNKVPSFTASNLLPYLNEIADFCIGNEKAEDVGFNQRTSFPELLAYVMTNPKDKVGIRTAMAKTVDLEKKVAFLKEQLRIMLIKVEIKYKK